MDAGTEASIQRVGREIFDHARLAEPIIFQQEWRQRRMLEWTMHNPRLRTQLFRFIDALPSLNTADDVAEHLREYLLKEDHCLPAPLDAALRIGSAGSLPSRITAIMARRNARQMARRFIAGETMEEAVATVVRLRKRRMAFTLDLLGEATTSESQADAYALQYWELTDAMSRAARDWKDIPQIDLGPQGPLPRVNVSLKLSSLNSQLDAIAPARSAEIAAQRFRPLLRLARERDAALNIDMEQYAHKDLVLSIFKSVLMEDEFRDFPHAGIVIQSYLRDSERDLKELIEWSRKRGHPITIRLVKGAYWDYETINSVAHGWPCPVFEHKWETDATFERLTGTLLENAGILLPAIASHNVRSLASAIVNAERLGLSSRDWEIQMLYGMGDPLKSAIVERGLRLRVYTPFGPLIPGMAYLIRRLLENTSNDSFLRQSFAEHASLQELLADPSETRRPSAGTPPPVNIDPDEEVAAMTPFINEPLTDFSVAENCAKVESALRDIRERQAGHHYPLLIGGHPIHERKTIESRDPSHPEFLIGKVSCASVADADQAVASARGACPTWRALPVAERADLLRNLADQMRRRRFELTAWIIIETGKPWREADADVVEAVDFCNFYAREMERLAGRPRQRHIPGEENYLVYEPRGVAAVIAPWNFPLAILTGMTTAALVTGNTVVVKPAEQSSVVAAKFFEMIGEAGFPPGVANYLPGIGEEIGAHLVRHPDVDLIAFTGSRAVGLNILESASRTQSGQLSVKKVIAEMGGKNAIIIDADADLDDAVKGVAASAFGYAGQKCSACSRVIVLAPIHDLFVKRLVETTRSLRCGPADDSSTMIGPLIDADARRRILDYIEKGKTEAELICQVDYGNQEGYFVGPVIFDHVPPAAAIAQEEIFGPVLSIITAVDFDEALRIANATDYALTGGVYSRNPVHIEKAKAEFRVGNLYVNRGITGAVVDRQPFGGFKMSGIGSKAGGPDYLLQFCEPKTISENTIRHGFAPAGRKED